MNFGRFTLLLSLCLILWGCGQSQTITLEQQLQDAEHLGDLERQKALIKTLSHQDRTQGSKWQALLEDIATVESLNGQARQLLDTQPLEALALAVQADQKRYNRTSREMLLRLLRPYKPLLPLYRPLREWAYPPFEKLIVPGSLIAPLTKWQQAVDRPTLWPDSALVNLLVAKHQNIERLFRPIAEERTHLDELLRLSARLAKSTPHDSHTQPLNEEVLAVNTMYNTVITDLHWHYLTQTLKKLFSQTPSAQPQQGDLKTFKLNNHYCCLYPAKNLAEWFRFYQHPSPYDEAVSELAKVLPGILEQLLSSETLPEPVRQALLSKLKQRVDKINTLSQAVDRPQIATAFLQALYNWQNDSLHELETIIPYLKHYQVALRGY